MIYLDNAATTRPYPEVLDRMREVADTQYANPHALHAFGVAAEREVNAARKTLAECLKAQPAEIVFTSGGTESNHIALNGWRRSRPGTETICWPPALSIPRCCCRWSAWRRTGSRRSSCR
jgi:cysteine desulfurase